MGHGKETPRQKMIGIMYLFLTCMLALNVSKDILDAFIMFNNTLNETNANFTSKNQIVYNAIAKAYDTNPVKAKKAYEAAQILRSRTDSLYREFQRYKDTIIVTADGVDKSKIIRGAFNKYFIIDEEHKDTVALEDAVSSKDNTDVPAQIMVGPEPDGSKGEGRFLKAKVDLYRDYVIDLAKQFGLDTTAPLVKSIKSVLSTDPLKSKHDPTINASWANRNFEHLPLMAVIANITQMQTQIRNIEGDIASLMFSQLDAGSHKFNTLEAIVVPESTYILKGSEYKANIILAAYDNTKLPIVKVGGRELGLDPETKKPLYKTTGGSLGPQKYNGTIEVLKPDGSGQFETYKFESEYIVGEPSLVISPTKMNVFYIGPDNPVKISVPGIPSDKIQASITPGYGSISKVKGDDYVVRVSKSGKCQISVIADFNGKKQSMGSVEFRVKTVPDPIAVIMNKDGGDVDKGFLIAANTVDAKMKDFDFDLKFTVEAFRISAKIGAYFVEEGSTSNKITPQMKNSILTKVVKNTKVYVEDIKARGPDGRPRKLGVLLFKIL